MNKKKVAKITDTCIKCSACAATCPVECISEGQQTYVVDPAKCINCRACMAICPVSAIIDEEAE